MLLDKFTIVHNTKTFNWMPKQLKVTAERAKNKDIPVFLSRMSFLGNSKFSKFKVHLLASQTCGSTNLVSSWAYPIKIVNLLVSTKQLKQTQVLQGLHLFDCSLTGSGNYWRVINIPNGMSLLEARFYKDIVKFVLGMVFLQIVTVIRSSNVNITLWLSSSINIILCLYSAPVSLARCENTLPDWKGIILLVIERTWIMSVIINIVNTTVSS